MKTAFQDYSNKTAEGEVRWCKKHPLGYWGKKKDGTWYERCVRGVKKNEDCIPGENDNGWD